MTRIFLGLGANIGNREANMRLALRWLARRCTIVAVSSLYRSDAVVVEGAAAGPDYLNAACEITTELAPADLLRFVKEIEYEIGRQLVFKTGFLLNRVVQFAVSIAYFLAIDEKFKPFNKSLFAAMLFG